MFFKKNNNYKDFSASYNLRKRYMFAIFFTALILILSQLATSFIMDKQMNDSTIVNVSGRQRTLSQTITKDALNIYKHESEEVCEEALANLKASLKLFGKSQLGLIHGDESMQLPGDNTENVIKMFDEIEPYYESIVGSSASIIKEIERTSEHNLEHISSYISTLRDGEKLFLTRMDDIVLEYEHEAEEKLRQSKNHTWLLLFIVLIILLLEGFIIFRPIEFRIKNAVELIKESEQNLQTLFDISPSPLLIVKIEDLSIVRLNEVAMAIVTKGYSNPIKKNINEFLFDDKLGALDLEKLELSSRGNEYDEIRLRDVDGSSHHALIHIIKSNYLNEGVFVIGITDISEIRKNELLLERFAQIDEMTGLYNRRTGMEFLEKEIAHIKRTFEDFTLCFIDLDNLKYINDVYGHKDGDLFISSFSKILLRNIREEDISFRYGGDEFIVLLKGCTKENADKIIKTVKSDLKKYSKTLNVRYSMEFSCGFAKYNEYDYNTVEAFISDADTQMYDDKKNKTVY